MLTPLVHFFARSLIGVWLSNSPHSWERHPVAEDSPHVHARGTNPDRVLLAGDGAATGRGVRTHDLGLGGYLARSLTARTNRATDVDLVVDNTMTVRTGRKALTGTDLARFDIIILSFGANEALALMSSAEWRNSLEALLLDVLTQAPRATKVFLLAIPAFGINPHFPHRLGSIVDEHVDRLNAVTVQLMHAYPEMVFVPESHEHAFELEGAHEYRQWAEEIGDRIAQNLDPARPINHPTADADEQGRQQALRHFETLSHERTLDLERFTEKAKRLFGTKIAAITFIRSDTETMRAVTGGTLTDLPRAESFCDITIRRSGHLVIHDALIDNRYSDYTLVTGTHGIRFYAGYPIEDPNGHRIGALCIMDTEPRPFNDHDASALRTLALTIQKHFYGTGPSPA